MKNKILIIALILVISVGYYLYYMQSDKKILNDFAYKVVGDSVKLEKVIDTYLNYDIKAKEITLLQLQSYKNDWNKNPKGIIVYSYEEAMAKGKGYNIESAKHDYIFFIYFNENLKMPVLLNTDSRIISICTINKGGRRFFLTTGAK